MLAIRLQRIGKKKFPTYRLIVSEKAWDTKGTYLEALGSFNPHVKEGGFKPDIERVNHWLKVGAMPSNTVNNLLVNAGVIKGEKKKSVFISQSRAKKLAEKKKTKEETAKTETAK